MDRLNEEIYEREGKENILKEQFAISEDRVKVFVSQEAVRKDG